MTPSYRNNRAHRRRCTGALHEPNPRCYPQLVPGNVIDLRDLSCGRPLGHGPPPPGAERLGTGSQEVAEVVFVGVTEHGEVQCVAPEFSAKGLT